LKEEMMSIFWRIKKDNSLKGKVIIVTGGNSGLGFEYVKFFSDRGATVIMACRNAEKGNRALQKILEQNSEARVDVLRLDLADLISVREFSKIFQMRYSRLDILMNNAGMMFVPYEKTKDGFESQLGVNYLGHFALTGLLFDLLKQTEDSRIISTSSIFHIPGTMNFKNLMYERGGYTPFSAYARSKMACLLFTYEFQRRIDENQLSMKALVVHPGGAKTDLFRYVRKNLLTYLFYPFFFLFTQSAHQGAFPGIRAALDKTVHGGTYFGPLFFLMGPPVKTFSAIGSYNKKTALKLWEISEELTGVAYNFHR